MHNVRRAHGSAVSGDLLATAEQGQSGNAADRITGAQSAFGFRINLGQPEFRFELCGRLRVGWCHHATRAAPWSPKIDQNGYTAALNVFVKSSGIQRHRLGHKQGFFAMAAIGRATELVLAHPVCGVAMRADDMKK